jgi:Type II secretion system (T2SS), protein M subtype b
MIYKLPVWSRRLLAISLLLAALSLTALLTVVPFMSQLASARERLEQERTIHGRLLDATQTQTIAEQLEQGSRAPKTTGLLIEGESESIRLATLQSQVFDIIAAHGVRSRTARMLQTRERNTLKLLGVQLQMTATMEQLQKILLQIEAHRPILLVETMHLTPTNSANTDDDRGLLDVKLDVLAMEARPKEAISSDARVKAP